MYIIEKIILSDVVVDEVSTFTLPEFYSHYAVEENFLLELLEHSLIDEERLAGNVLQLDVRSLRRIQSAARLQQDLDINLPGIALVLELVDELDKAREELALLKKQIEKTN